MERSNFSKRTDGNTKRSPALLPVPEKLRLLMRLANLLPKSLRRSPTSHNNEPNLNPRSSYWFVVRDYWNTRSDEETIHSMYYLRRLADELPLELQAFVLRDDECRQIKVDYSPGYAPLFDPYHLQPLENITYLEQPTEKLSIIVAEAKERIEVETDIAETRASSAKDSSDNQAPQMVQFPHMRGGDYQIGNCTFSEMGLRNLANRARQRFFFILAAEEILDALVGPETQKKLNGAWYVGESGTTRGHLYVNNDEVKLSPPILFSFVVNVQASRVRRCGICEDYFWAGRKDKKTCSERCSATSRKRKERERYFEIKIGERKVKKSGQNRTSKERLQSGANKKGK
jgi:hypothetical protein